MATGIAAMILPESVGVSGSGKPDCKVDWGCADEAKGMKISSIGWQILCSLLVIGWGVAWSEEAPKGRIPVDPPTVRPLAVVEPPEMDGEVLGDPAYEDAVPATGFWQTQPDAGFPSSERTEVYIVNTGSTLYFGIVCFDEEPEKIISTSSRRDSPLVDTDSFQLILDTYQDQLTGFVFGTNPAGIEYDGQVTREGQGGFGSQGGFNLDWDGSWQVRTKVSEIGWSAEFAIPFRTVRFPRGQNQVWGVNFQRNIRRRLEVAFWSPIPLQFNLFRLSHAGSLDGLEIPRQQNLKVMPFVVGAGQKQGEEGAEIDGEGNVGLDVKFSITPSLTLDGTVNTDFAEVEADFLQVNLDRFNLFFPEKRPFFLENAGFFSVGVPAELQLFYSRRIGLGPDGEVVPIDGGVRLSGKAGHYNLGLLYMGTEEVDEVAPRNRFSVVRLGRDLPNRSFIGGILINREGSGDQALADDENWTYGVDGRWGIGDNTTIEGFAARTRTPGVSEDEYAYRLAGQHDTELWSMSVGYDEVAEGFNPEVGFLTRQGYRKPSGFLLRRIRPQNMGKIFELRPHISYRGYWNFDGFQETGFLHLDNHWEFRQGAEIHTGINFTQEGLTDPFEIAEGIEVPAGTYKNTEAQLIAFTNRSAPLSFEARLVAGGFLSGDRISVSPTVRYRIGDRFSSSLDWQYNDIDLAEGAFETHLGRLRLSYSFTLRLFVQALVQYSDRDDLWATNLRIGWLNTASTGLYLVYNEIRDTGDLSTGVPDRRIVLKYSHLFDVLK